jgi:hypothetical protein
MSAVTKYMQYSIVDRCYHANTVFNNHICYSISFQHMSAIRSFKTAPRLGSDVGFKFIVYGDHGVSPAAHTTAKYVLNDTLHNGYEFIFHNGDISYARGMVCISIIIHSSRVMCISYIQYV